MGGVTNSFTELVRNYVCNTPTSTAGFCFSSYSDVGAIMVGENSLVTVYLTDYFRGNVVLIIALAPVDR